MTAQLIPSDSRMVPRGTVTYSVWVWSTVESRKVTATVATAGRAMGPPTFALCPAPHGATCSIGSLPADQAFEVLVTDKIGKKATAGEQITMTAIVQGEAQSPAGVALSPAEAAVSAVLGQPGSSTSSPGSGTTVPTTIPTTVPTTVPELPGTTVTPPGNLSSIFPTVTPSGNRSASGRRGSRHKVAGATSTASSLPLDPRLIGGQLAGLAVLATAITMVVARLSLRSPQPTMPSPQTPAPQTPAPQVEGDASSAASPPDDESPRRDS